MATSLNLKPCGYHRAKYACLNWHYSKAFPAGRTFKVGVFENNVFIGAVIFGKGPNKNFCKPYRVKQSEICELARVALRDHITPVSRIVSIALKELKKHCPGIRIVISYADKDQNHHGGIYQAGNWIYEGVFADTSSLIINGRKVHRRTVNSKYNSSSLQFIRDNVDEKARLFFPKGKHKYVYLFDKRIKIKSKPYPKRGGSIDIDASGDQSEQGGVSPTPSLQP